MLNNEENALICRVGPGMPAGDVMREYWLPALLSSELPEADGPPLRVRLLGEDLIAFRDSAGRVGLLAAHCPHRGASLFFGRNEEQGLRCVYHGWKFDAGGACLDMPSEPAESNFKDRVRTTAYPCQERNGVIWAYMGPGRPACDPPSLEWNLVPEEQRYISKRVQECNWLQALEGGIDSTHSAFLHGSLNREQAADRAAARPVYSVRQTHVRYELADTEYGMLLAARRDAEAGSAYWRISHLLMPFYNMFPPRPSTTLGGLAWVPMDDETTMVWNFTWHPTRALLEGELPTYSASHGPNAGSISIHAGLDDLLSPTSAPGGAWRPKANRSNDYALDYDAQRTTRFFGVPSVWAQDAAIQESMGPIVDRTREHLGTSDGGIIGVRQLWLRTVRAHAEQGVVPPGASTPDAFRVRPVAVVLPEGVPWLDGARDLLEARPGVLLDAL